MFKQKQEKTYIRKKSQKHTRTSEVLIDETAKDPVSDCLNKIVQPNGAIGVLVKKCALEDGHSTGGSLKVLFLNEKSLQVAV